jgi:hypothetical protein
VIATRKNAAEHVTTPGAVPADPHNPRAYLILIRGRFVCSSCSGPVGAEPPRGRVAYEIWMPGHGISDFGLQRAVPRGLHRLGRVVRLRLVPPRIPASELALHPGRGIGPGRLGMRVRALDSRLGPAISPGQYVFGPIEVDIHRYHRRVDHLIVLSARATIDGHALSEGYDRLRRELAGWTELVCRDGPRAVPAQPQRCLHAAGFRRQSLPHGVHRPRPPDGLLAAVRRRLGSSAASDSRLPWPGNSKMGKAPPIRAVSQKRRSLGG